MIRAGAHLRPGTQIEDTGGIRTIVAGFPLLALCVVTGDQFRRQEDGARAGCACGRRGQRHGNPEDPVGGMCGRLSGDTVSVAPGLAA